MQWLELSEIVAGLLLQGRLAPSSVTSDDLIDPYSGIVNLAKHSSNGIEPEPALDLLGLSAYTAAMSAADSVNLPVNWPRLLEQSAVRHDAGIVFKSVGERLARGEEVDTSAIETALGRLDRQESFLTSLDNIVPVDNPFVKTGFKPFDQHLGGLPDASLTVIGASPGTGKTSLMLQIAASFAKRKKRVLCFSMEMTMQFLATRLLDIQSLTPAQKTYIDICDEVLSPSEVNKITSRASDADLVCVDFAELMLTGGDGSENEKTMGKIYKTLAWMSKNLRVPVILLSQLNRSSAYQGRLPNLTDYRYSGMAEAMASMAMLLYNPNVVYMNSTNGASPLPPIENKGYIIVAKSRYGFSSGSKFQHTSAGAIQVTWDGASGWGNNNKSVWFPLSSSTA